MASSVVIEGYASLFGIEDLAGDVVRAGAFTRSLARRGAVRMLLSHLGGMTAGAWSVIREDGRGLYVRGLVTTDAPAGASALAMIRRGALEGLSIGFIARNWAPRPGGGRELRDIDLREISLVAAPMLPGARFAIVGAAILKGRDAA